MGTVVHRSELTRGNFTPQQEDVNTTPNPQESLN